MRTPDNEQQIISLGTCFPVSSTAVVHAASGRYGVLEIANHRNSLDIGPKTHHALRVLFGLHRHDRKIIDDLAKESMKQRVSLQCSDGKTTAQQQYGYALYVCFSQKVRPNFSL